VGRVGDDATGTPAVHAGGDLPTVHAGTDLPGSGAGNHLPGGGAHEHGPGPSASHELPRGHTGGQSDGTGGGHDGHRTGDSREVPSGGHGDTAHPSGHNDGAAHGGDGQGQGSDAGGSSHDHVGQDGPQADRDARDPRGSVADDAARRAADPIQLGDQPIPPPAAGENSLGHVPESRVQRDADGLITHVDGRNFEHFLKDLSYQRGVAFREAKEQGLLSRRAVGPCAGQVMDLRTGNIIEAMNGRPDDLIKNVHPTIAARLDNLPEPWPAPDQPLRHAEVKAANALLWERRKLGLPDGEEALAELRAAMEFPYYDHMQTGLPGRPAPFCANCNHMLDGVDSLHGRFTGEPVDDNWKP
ncbi:YwqJ-related putative deaminase, partial [Streptomyces sp. NPDC052015]|uniref:YwqJ-related putative deaminase n=1 Tax=Streptomyces sp. NPDC052015 TaxID=3154755 RepID=UPI00341CE232